jgi:hypothetical protein
MELCKLYRPRNKAEEDLYTLLLMWAELREQYRSRNKAEEDNALAVNSNELWRFVWTVMRADDSNTGFNVP